MCLKTVTNKWILFSRSLFTTFRGCYFTIFNADTIDCITAIVTATVTTIINIAMCNNVMIMSLKLDIVIIYHYLFANITSGFDTSSLCWCRSWIASVCRVMIDRLVAWWCHDRWRQTVVMREYWCAYRWSRNIRTLNGVIIRGDWSIYALSREYLLEYFSDNFANIFEEFS